MTAPVEPARAAPRPAPAPAAGGRLAIDFEHHLKSGRLRVWVDGDLVLEEELDARVTKKILSFSVRKGMVDETLEVRPGPAPGQGPGALGRQHHRPR